jgi:hypothetical protein
MAARAPMSALLLLLLCLGAADSQARRAGA